MSIVRKGRIDPIEILKEFITQKKSIKFKKEKNDVYKIIFENIEMKSNMVGEEWGQNYNSNKLPAGNSMEIEQI